MASKTKTRKLRICAGAGAGAEIDAEIAACYSGRPVVKALGDLIDAHVQDPQLRAMLDHPQLALEVYGEDAEGALEESPLSPDEQFDRVLKLLEKADAEVGIARSHRGGRGRTAKRRAAKRALAPRLPYQNVTCHRPTYELSEPARRAVARGRALYLTGEVLAQIQVICGELGGREALWYYLASAEDPSIIRDVIIPEQRGSAASCKASGSEVLRIGRLARKRGMTVVGAGHSHGWGGLFSSGIDKDQMSELADESVGYLTSSGRTVKNSLIRPAPSHHDGVQAFEVCFEDNGSATTVNFKTRGRDAPEIKAEDLDIQLHQRRRRIISIFSTHNCRGKHFFPALEVDSCPMCGAKRERFIDARDIEIHVIGPVVLSDAAQERLQDEVRSKVKTWTFWNLRTTRSYCEIGQDGHEPHLNVAASAAGADTEPGPAAFRVYRRGNLVGTVAAVVMERAAAETPMLAAALGWQETAEKP